MTAPVLTISGLSKKYCHGLRRSLRYGVADIAREFGIGCRHSDGLRPGEFWVLQDVSLSVGAGEALAVLGANGAGKSTLLRAAYGLLKPDRGEVRVDGRVAAIIELGAGLDPLLTGRENIRLGGAYHGLSGRQVRRLTDEVEAFAELGAFIDSPLQSYSSGMRARLAYALAAQLRADLLLVDEALAVGDLDFQRKCVAHMRQYIADGGALVFVSHNILQVQSVCTRAVLLDRGVVTASGEVADTVARLFDRPSPPIDPENPPPARGPVTITATGISSPGDGRLRMGEPAHLSLDCVSDSDRRVRWGFSVWTADNWICVGGALDPGTTILARGQSSLTCTIPRLPMMAGSYWLRASMLDAETDFLLTDVSADPGRRFEVFAPASPMTNLRMRGGQLTDIETQWS